MAMQINHKQVWNNLIRLRETLLQKKDEKVSDPKRVYLTLLNLDTGDFQFAQKISDLSDPFAKVPTGQTSYKNWKQVRLVVRDEGGAVHFEMCDAREQQLEPSNIDMKPLAWDVLSETLSVLNTMAKVSRVVSGKLLPEAAVLSSTNFSEIRFSLDQSQIENLDEWAGNSTRIEAEKRLSGQSVGSYLVRAVADPVSQSILSQIAENNRISFFNSCFLTVVEKEGKISDILLLRTEKGWTYYQDNVHFQGGFYTYYSSIESLIKELI